MKYNFFYLVFLEIITTSMNFHKILFVFLFVISMTQAQQDPTLIYRAEREKVNNLVHTKLKVNFDFKNKQLNGEEWLTLSPHFYPVSKVILDAKAMLIHRWHDSLSMPRA